MRKFCFALALTLTFVLPAQAEAWDGAQTVTKSRAAQLTVAGNEHGRRVVAWADGAGVFARVAPRGGRFGPRLRLAGTGGTNYVRAAMDARGNTVFVWTQFVDADPTREAEPGYGIESCCVRLVSAVLRRDGRFSRPGQLGVPDAFNTLPLLYSDSRGRIAMAWGTYNEHGSPLAVYARFGTMRRGFGRLRLMSPPGEYFGDLLSAARGRVIYSTSYQTVETSQRPDGRLARRVLLDFPSGGAQVETDDRGRQTGAWDTGETTTRTPPGPFETVAEREAGRDPRLSVAGSGAAVVAWTPGESESTPPTGLKAFVRPPDGEFAAPLELDSPGGAYDITIGGVDAGPDGGAAVGAIFWHRQEPDPILQPRVYLLPPGGDSFERLTFPQSDGSGLQVLSDARGTLAVMRTTAGGFVARWVR